ncbi:MAG: GerMN domain-containing protein, partial [Chloroflexales bacterium]|nr:GerMN domain-containing protein [Chloroflexales bacterium]
VAEERVEAAALEALLWGPPRTQMSFHTALPTPQEVLAYPGRQPGWGARVTLRSLAIHDGVATADFSPELLAYGGGSARVLAIREQITRTLTSFAGIHTVHITVDGRTDALEP